MIFEDIRDDLKNYNASLVAVSKTKPVEAIKALYLIGQRDFGENRVQELIQKQPNLPNDIRWHHIGHLQKNKVKYIIPFVHLIHAVDSERLLGTIIKESKKVKRTVDVLLQIKIATEESKFGMDEQTILSILHNRDIITSPYIRIKGLMAMASFVDSEDQVREEFTTAKRLFDHIKELQIPGLDDFEILSMGMSGDYQLALECGSNMLRIGSLLFGPRT